MLKITEFQSEDVNLILKWITTQEDLISWSGKQFSFPLQSTELVNYFKDFEDKPDTFKAFNIELDEEKIGHCELANINTIEKDAAFISKAFLRKELRQKGYATLAISALLNFAFVF